MKRTVLSLVIFIFLSVVSRAQDFKQHIVFLASDSLHGRAAGSADEIKAANYIAGQFKAAGCNRVLYQKFQFGKDSAINVVGFLDRQKDSTIIISAHYDHLGYGSAKALDFFKKGIHPGADDNASGVAMMIELARWLAKSNSESYNLVFAAYSGHEEGLYGSDYFVKSGLCAGMKIRAVFNFDMVGRLDDMSKTVRVSGLNTDVLLEKYFKSIQGRVLNFRFDDALIPDSDLKGFAAQNILVLNLTTGTSDDYHKMTDTENKINYEGMKKIFNVIQSLLIQQFQVS